MNLKRTNQQCDAAYDIVTKQCDIGVPRIASITAGYLLFINPNFKYNCNTRQTTACRKVLRFATGALILFVCFAKEAHFCSFRDGNAFCLFVIAKEQNRTSAKPSTKSR